MIYALAFIAAAALADPASAPNAAATPDIAPDKISYQGVGNGWTGGRTSWWIDRSGRGHFESTEHGRHMSKRISVGVEGFERLRHILQPLDGLKAMPCEGGGVSDQATGALTWKRRRQATALHLDFGCAQNDTANAWARFGEANALIAQWSAPRD
jgi:hypothetical protein